MPSPFPGMNPFLEQEVIWHDFQERFLPAAAAHLAAQVLPRYIVLIDEHVYLHDLPPDTRGPAIRPDLSVARGPEPGAAPGAVIGVLEAPAEVILPDLDVERESFLSVLDRLSREVIAVVELLSPTNKRPGDNRKLIYQREPDPPLNGEDAAWARSFLPPPRPTTPTEAKDRP